MDNYFFGRTVNLVKETVEVKLFKNKIVFVVLNKQSGKTEEKTMNMNTSKEGYYVNYVDI